MTSLAFILGVVPLVTAAGAGAELRQSLGTAVFFGMLGVTGFGLIYTPVFSAIKVRFNYLLTSSTENSFEPMRRRLNSRQIEAFRAVMVTGGVTAAARQLRVAQPSLSRMLKRIEDLVGFPLFERSKGRLLPTLEARQLFASVQHIQAQIESLDNVIEQIGKGGAGLFRFGASPSLARQFMATCLARLRETFPEVRIHFDVTSLSDIVDYLALGIGECFVTMTPIVNPVVDCVEIGTGRLVCLLPASHRLANRQSLAGSDLLGEKLIMCEPGSPHGLLTRAVFKEIEAEPEVSITARFAELAIGLTGAGLGVAIVDEFTALGAASDTVAVRALQGSPRFQVYLSRGKDQSVSRLSHAFERVVREQLAAKENKTRSMP